MVFGEPLERAPGETEEAFLARADFAIDSVTSEADRLCGVNDAPRQKERAA